MTSQADRSGPWPEPPPRSVPERLDALEHGKDQILRVLGSSPDPAIGEAGSGLCRAVTELKSAQRSGHRKVAGAAVAIPTGLLVVFEVLARIFGFGGIG